MGAWFFLMMNKGGGLASDPAPWWLTLLFAAIGAGAVSYASYCQDKAMSRTHRGDDDRSRYPR